MSRRSLFRLSQQPVSASSLADATVSPPRLPHRRGTGPDVDRVPATGDQTGGVLVDVGADFFTAAELAALKLQGLPLRRQHISRMATNDGWSFRAREGRGGGREFPLSALPAKARGEIIRRRLIDGASKHGREIVPPAIDNLTTGQATRLGARTQTLAAFDSFRGDRSVRSSLAPFVAAVRDGHVELQDWVKRDVRRLSERTLRRWLDARTNEATAALAGAGRRGPLPVLELSGEAAHWIVGAMIDQPHLSKVQLAQLLGVEFPEGVPDAKGLLMQRPGARAIGRFIERWLADPANKQAMVSLTDPDRWRSHYRFAGGDASAGIVRLNQRWQIDASPADALCSDGRHSIYIVIDVWSRRMMGLVSRTPRTVASLLLVARACEAWGVPEILATDNGSDFVSQHFVDAMLRLRVHHAVMPPYSPERKAFVERGIGTVQRGLMAMLPGFAGHSVAQRSQIEQRVSFAQRLGESEAKLFSVALSGAELQQRLDAWLANVYARTPHRGIGETPELRSLRGAEANPPKFAHPGAIGMLLMPPPNDGATRVVTKKGIAVGNLDYWCDGLIAGQKVQVRLDPQDLGQIYAYTDTNPWVFLGIARNPDAAGISRAELTGRVKAAQDVLVRDHRAKLRQLKRATNLPAVVERLIGAAPLAVSPPTDAPAHDSPDLIEAAIAAATEGTRPKRAQPEATAEEHAQHEVFVTDFQSAREARQLEETAEERYARWKRLKELVDAGGEISTDSRRWFERYPDTPQWKAQRSMEEEFGGS